MVSTGHAAGPPRRVQVQVKDYFIPRPLAGGTQTPSRDKAESARQRPHRIRVSRPPLTQVPRRESELKLKGGDSGSEELGHYPCSVGLSGGSVSRLTVKVHRDSESEPA